MKEKKVTIREVAELGGDTRKFVPGPVLKALRAKIKEKSVR